MAQQRTLLLTGFPSAFLARRLLLKLLAAEPAARVVCLTPRKQIEAAEAAQRVLSAEQRARTEILTGDTSDMDFGLSGKQFLELARRIDVVHHCAFATYAGVRRPAAERMNIGGTAEVLELCEAGERGCRLVLWSTASVSGKLQGRVAESELREPPSFPSAVEETRFRAEQMVRASMDHVPTTILRPSIIVGDTHTGEIDRMEGPYLLILLMLSSPVDLRVPLPGRGDVPLNLVPIDYVIEAGHAIARDPRSIGRTFHIVDENPPTARRVFELIAEATGRPGPVGSLPSQLATALLRTPGLERFSHIPRTFIEQLATDVTYDARNTRELLAGTGIECPKAATYLTVMVDYVRSQQQKRALAKQQQRRRQEEVEEDPLG
jgi:nucleoside-diphosphate-sugar epimerase